MKLIVLSILISYCVARNIFPQENDINFKRMALRQDATGKFYSVDLAEEEPQNTKVEVHHVSYYLYTRNNMENPERILEGNVQSVQSSPVFNSKRRNLFVIHGWMDSYTADVNQYVYKAALKKHDLNVFVVDWSPLAKALYGSAKGSVVGVGHLVGQFINKMMDEYGLDGSKFMIIGHSLGAHIAGNAGSVTKSPVDHIIGLDPAAPLFTLDNTEERLDPTDAAYVQIIHTHGFFLGFGSSIGHVDYYPNGGMMQAGCGLDLGGGCSHARSFQFLAESIEFEGKFIATQCDSWDNFEAGKCDHNKKAIMGEINVDKKIVGDYYLRTAPEAPFALSN